MRISSSTRARGSVCCLARSPAQTRYFTQAPLARQTAPRLRSSAHQAAPRLELSAQQRAPRPGPLQERTPLGSTSEWAAPMIAVAHYPAVTTHPRTTPTELGNSRTAKAVAFDVTTTVSPARSEAQTPRVNQMSLKVRLSRARRRRPLPRIEVAQQIELSEKPRRNRHLSELVLCMSGTAESEQ